MPLLLNQPEGLNPNSNCKLQTSNPTGSTGMGSHTWSYRQGDIGGIWQIPVHLPESPLKSESHSEAPFNLFQAPLSTCLGSLLWITPLQISLSSVKISRAGECLPHSLNARALSRYKKVSWLSYVYNGNPLKGGLLTHWPLGDLN